MQEHLGRLDLPAPVRVAQRGGLDEVDGPVEKRLEVGEQAEVGVRVACRRQGLEVDEEIQVAPRGVIVGADSRAEEGEAAHRVAAVSYTHLTLPTILRV